MILTETKDNIILISSFDEESQCGGGGCTIPKSCVKEIVQLKEDLEPKRDVYGIHN